VLPLALCLLPMPICSLHPVRCTSALAFSIDDAAYPLLNQATPWLVYILGKTAAMHYLDLPPPLKYTYSWLVSCVLQVRNLMLPTGVPPPAAAPAFVATDSLLPHDPRNPRHSPMLQPPPTSSQGKEGYFPCRSLWCIRISLM